VPGDRRGGALALRPGDAEDAVPIGLGQPQPEAAGDRHAGVLERAQVLPGPGDAGRLDDDVALGEGLQPTCFRADDVRRGGRVVDHDLRLHAERGELAQVRPALDPEPPDADRPVAQVRPGDRRRHTALR
jgi:hypothetical protein